MYLLGRARSTDARVSLHAKWSLMDQVRRYVMPEFILTDFAKRWFEDEEFLAAYHRLLPSSSMLTAKRKYFLRELIRLVSHLEGDTAEAGVYTAASSWFICAERAGHNSTHWAFDSFQGLSEPSAADGRRARPWRMAGGRRRSQHGRTGSR